MAHRTLSSCCWIVYHVSAPVEAKPKYDEKFTKLWKTGGFCLLYFSIWSTQTEEHFEWEKNESNSSRGKTNYFLMLVQTISESVEMLSSFFNLRIKEQEHVSLKFVMVLQVLWTRTFLFAEKRYLFGTAVRRASEKKRERRRQTDTHMT